MSRVGSSPIDLKGKATATIKDNEITIKGTKGEKSFAFSNLVNVQQEGESIVVAPSVETSDKKYAEAKKLWGTTRACINNLFLGVTEGFKVTLELTGVGYRASVKGSDVVLQLGYSNDVVFKIPEGITITCTNPTTILIEGTDKQQVGQVAANIKKLRKMEPYKGKGIKRTGDYVIRKEGKKK